MPRLSKISILVICILLIKGSLLKILTSKTQTFWKGEHFGFRVSTNYLVSVPEIHGCIELEPRKAIWWRCYFELLKFSTARYFLCFFYVNITRIVFSPHTHDLLCQVLQNYYIVVWQRFDYKLRWTRLGGLTKVAVQQSLCSMEWNVM